MLVVSGEEVEEQESAVSTRVAGRISLFIDFWKLITSDKFILEVIEGLHIPFENFPSQNIAPKQINCSLNEKHAIDLELNKYVEKGIIEEVDHEPGEFLSQIFHRDKRSGGIRIILNLSLLNKDVEYCPFKMDTLNNAILLMEKGCYMTSLDSEDAYYFVNVNPKFRKFLRFEWGSKLYEFTCMPNGLACAPRIFTRILKPIFENLRKNGHISIYYLDDSWLMGSTYEKCLDNTVKTAEILTKAGFILNKAKSCSVPSQKIIFLGFELDSVKMLVSLPLEKRNNLHSLCSEILDNKKFSIRFLAKFIGILVSSLPAVEYGALYYRFLECRKIDALKQNKGNFNALTCLNENCIGEVIWWQNNIFTTKRNILIAPPNKEIVTDASLIGWGAVLEGISTGGHWNENEKCLHINVLELKAILFGL